MKKALFLLIFAGFFDPTYAQIPNAPNKETKTVTQEEFSANNLVFNPDQNVVTEHNTTIKGQKVSYKATTGTMPVWDEDGKAYLSHAYAGSRAGIKSVLVVKPMNWEGTQTTGSGKMVFDGHEAHPTVEGTKFYKRNGFEDYAESFFKKSNFFSQKCVPLFLEM